MIDDGSSEIFFQLKYKEGVGYVWLFNNGEPRSPVFQTQLEAELWERREHGEFPPARRDRAAISICPKQ